MDCEGEQVIWLVSFIAREDQRQPNPILANFLTRKSAFNEVGGFRHPRVGSHIHGGSRRWGQTLLLPQDKPRQSGPETLQTTLEQMGAGTRRIINSHPMHLGLNCSFSSTCSALPFESWFKVTQRSVAGPPTTSSSSSSLIHFYLVRARGTINWPVRYLSSVTSARSPRVSAVGYQAG